MGIRDSIARAMIHTGSAVKLAKHESQHLDEAAVLPISRRAKSIFAHFGSNGRN